MLRRRAADAAANMPYHIKAKFHYAKWFEDGSKLAGRRPASNQLRTS